MERIRTFAQRVRGGTWPAGHNSELEAQTAKAEQNFCAAMADDLNTSEARAAILDLVRAGNIAADSGRLYTGNVAAIVEALRRFERSLPSSKIAMRRSPVPRSNGRRRKGGASRRRLNWWLRIRLATNRSTLCWQSESRRAEPQFRPG